MADENKEFAIIMNFDGDLRCNAIYGFRTGELAVKAADAIRVCLGVPSRNMIIVQTKGDI